MSVIGNTRETIDKIILENNPLGGEENNPLKSIKADSSRVFKVRGKL